METGRVADSRGRHLLRVGFVLVTLFTAGLVTSGVVAGAGPLAVLSDSTTTETTTESGTTSTESTTESTTTEGETTSEETTTESTTTESESTTTESTPAPSGPPTIASDKDDYSPGALVTLTGTNWQSGETVNIDVNDDVGQTWRRNVDVVADGSGEIVDRFNLPDWFVATYRVVATGATSGTASTTFTDGDIRVRAGRPPTNTNTAVTIAAGDLKLYASSNCSGASGSSNTNAFTTGSGGGNGYASPSPAMNAPSGTSLSVNVPATVTVGATTYSFSSWVSDNTSTAVHVATTGTTGCFRATSNGQGSFTANYVVQTDTTAPTVVSINRSGTSPTNTTGNLSWTVVFSESVTGVDAADFALANTGLGGSPAIGTVTGSGANYTVPASSGTGSGTLGLNLVDNDTIADAATNKLGGTGIGNGNFTGQVYTIDRTAPTITAAAVTLPGSAVYLANTWTNKDVQVTFTCSDAGGSGLTGSSGNQTQDFTTETSGTTATFGGTCADNAGNSAAAATFGPIKIDKTDPTLSVTHTANGSNGWNTSSPVSLSITASDGLSGLAGSPTCTDNGNPLPVSGSSSPWSASVSGLGVHDIDCSILDNAGNDQTATDQVKIDTTAPVIAGSVSGTLGSNGWYVGDVDVSWTVTDPESGIATSAGCGPTTVSTDTTGLTITCSATNAAGLSDSESVTVKRDATDPSVTVNLARDPDHNGWYNHGVGYRAVGSDATSGIAGCDPGAVYDGPDSATASVSLDCTDNAGNEGSGSAAFKYDDTDPSVTVNLARDPDHNGWYNHGVGYRAVGSDATSGIAGCDPGAVYDGPDSATASVSLDCTDNAGNEGSGSAAFKYDDTDPSVTVNLARDPDHNGWYNHGVGYRAVGSDATSGIAGCDPGAVYDGPDSATASVSLDCTDNAGNEGSGSAAFKYDDTDPSVTVNLARDPDHNGWYNHGVGYRAVGSDATSGIAGCDPGAVYDGPDSATASVSLDCTDNAGNEGSGSAAFKYDDTDPSVTVNLARDPDHNGWYNHGVGYRAVGSDATSGIAGCDPGAVYDGPDSATASVSLDCTDNAGNEGSGSAAFKYDDTDPSVTVNLARDPDHNGWYNHGVGYRAVGSDATSGIAGCDPGAVYDGPDSATASVSLDCTDNAGNEGSGSAAFKYDDTDPSVTVNLARDPDHNGWYNHGVGYRAVGSDATSGIAGCDPGAVYDGPDSATASVSLDCTDNAGNEGSGSAAFKYDDTDPSVTVNLARDPDHNGWYNHGVGYRAVGSDATSGIAGCDPGAVYDGPDSATASVSLDCTDNAGNEGSGSAAFKYDATAPSADATAAPAPNANGWNKTNVTVTFTGTDAVSGIGSCDPAVVLSSEGAGQSASGTCTDNAGNTSAPATASGINIDKTAPTVALVGGPAHGASYHFGFVPAAPTCTASDGLSGLDGSCTVSGYGTTVGSHTVSATATDIAGNSASVSRTYTVLAWTLTGFFQPVDMGGVFNVVKGGSTVPLKFRIFAGATELTDVAHVKSLKHGLVACDAAAPNDDIETVATGGTSLRYDTSGGQFIYNWKTPATPGKCYSVTMTTQDGSTLNAYFKMK